MGTPDSPNGIAYVTPIDLDGDNIYDYAYAGDIKVTYGALTFYPPTVMIGLVNRRSFLLPQLSNQFPPKLS